MSHVRDDRRDPAAQPRVGGLRPRFEPQVARPVARMRPAFALALVATVAFALGVIAWDVWLNPSRVELSQSFVAFPARPAQPRAQMSIEPRAMMPSGCTSLEVELTIRAPAMTDIQRVTCLAVAGKIERARAMLLAMPGTLQSQAIARVFDVAHPIADRGDDASAGPIMALVIEFWPQNYMAVFHAGMADFALGRDNTARKQLESFLLMYSPYDVWRARAQQALTAIATHTPLDQRQAHFPE